MRQSRLDKILSLVLVFPFFCLASPSIPKALADNPTIETIETVEAELDNRFCFAASLPSSTCSHNTPTKIFLHYKNENRHYLISLSAREAQLEKVDGGHRIPLSVGLLPKADDSPMRIIVMRDPERISLVVGGRLLWCVHDDSLHGGRLAIAPGCEHRKLEQIRYQPVEEVFFTDDFARTPDHDSPWEPKFGNWTVSGPDSPAPDPRLSANPFSYRAHVDAQSPKALTQVGYWFWHNYAVEAAVRVQGRASAGLCAHMQDISNFILIELELSRHRPAVTPGRLRLVLIQNGVRSTLASCPVAVEADQWYKLKLLVCEGVIEGYLDDHLLLTSYDSSFANGKIGLYASGEGDVFFDDVMVYGVNVLIDDFQPTPSFTLPTQGEGQDGGLTLTGGGRERRSSPVWTARGGSWQRRDGNLVASLTNPRPNAPSSRGAWLTTCPGTGDEKAVALSTTLLKLNGACGIAVGLGSNSYVLLHLQRLGQRLRVDLIEDVEGSTEILDQKVLVGSLEPLPLSLAVDGLRVWAQVTDKFRLVGGLRRPATGSVGFFLGRGSAEWDYARLQWGEDSEQRLKVAEQFQKEHTMVDWATERGAFFEDRSGNLWHRGLFFGDLLLTMPLPSSAKLTGKVSIFLSDRIGNPLYTLLIRRESETTTGLATLPFNPLLFSPPRPEDVPGERPRSGGRVRSKEKSTVQFELYQADRLILSSSYQPSQVSKGILHVRQAGAQLTATLNERQVLRIERDDVTDVRRLGLRLEGWEPEWERVSVSSSHLFDDAFSCSPVQWWVGRGVWDVTNRWVCQPGWSWFGGSEHRSPLLWSKQTFQGDMVVECFVALKMSSGNPAYPNPRDLNLTICGDGWNVSSGYTLVFAGWRNQQSALLRNGEVVMVNGNLTLDNPTNLNLQRFHRHWYRLRMEKVGKRVRGFVDDQLAFSYDDPNPLHGGRIGIWTVDNGILIARVRAWYEGVGAWEPMPSLPPSLAQTPIDLEVFKTSQLPADRPLPFQNKFDDDRDLWIAPKRDDNGAHARILRSGDNRYLRITNWQAGGAFYVTATNQPFTVKDRPTLSFRYRITQDVKVNIYLHIDGKRYAILFTGSQTHDTDIPVVGKVENIVADGQWRTVNVNLLQLLSQHQTNAPDLIVNEVFFANLGNDDYLFVGATGNPLGAIYDIDDFQLMESQPGAQR